MNNKIIKKIVFVFSIIIALAFIQSCKQRESDEIGETSQQYQDISQQINDLKLKNEDLKNSTKLLQDDMTQVINNINQSVLEMNKNLETLEISMNNLAKESSVMLPQSKPEKIPMIYRIIIGVVAVLLIIIFVKIRLNSIAAEQKRLKRKNREPRVPEAE